MTGLAPLTAARFISVWHFDPWVTGAIVVILAGYLIGVRSAERRGVLWPKARTAWFVGLGVGAIVISTMSSIEVYSKVLLWPMALQVTLLLTVVPVGLGLGDPLGLVTAALPPAGATRWRGVLDSRVVRVLTFPGLSPVLAVATQFLVFFTGYVGAAERSGTVLHLLQLQLVVTGCLFALPLLGVEALPAWCTQPIRMAFAAVDGLLDAIPGIVVMTSSSLVAAGYYGHVKRSWGPSHSWDQIIGGGLMFTIAEVIAVPFIAILYRAWIREDATAAAVIDRKLDLEDLRRDATPYNEAPVASRPWWETDPGPLADRASRYGWGDDKPAD